jgi:hypothetical protein
MQSATVISIVATNAKSADADKSEKRVKFEEEKDSPSLIERRAIKLLEESIKNFQPSTNFEEVTRFNDEEEGVDAVKLVPIPRLQQDVSYYEPYI